MKKLYMTCYLINILLYIVFLKIKSVKKFYEISQWTPAELKRFEDLAKDESRIHICYGKPPF